MSTPEHTPTGAYFGDGFTVWPFTTKREALACLDMMRAERDREGLRERYRVVARTISALGVKIPMWCLCILTDAA